MTELHSFDQLGHTRTSVRCVKGSVAVSRGELTSATVLCADRVAVPSHAIHQDDDSRCVRDVPAPIGLAVS